MAMTTDERKARDAERKRLSRAAARATSAATKPKTTDAADGPRPTVMHDAVESALSAMKWLVDSDTALVAIGRAQAAQIDALSQLTAPTSVALHLRVQSALSRTLQALAGTPRARLQLEVRSARLQPPAGAAASSTIDAPGSNVTKFKRPQKRAPQR